MKKIKVIQIGVGHDHATSIFDSVINQPEVFEFVGFAVPDCEKIKFDLRINDCINRNIRFYDSVSDALNVPGLDAVIVETEEENLTRYALMAAKMGLHVHMDKPSGLEFNEFNELINVLKSKKLTFTTGYMYRFNPAVEEMKKMIKDGKLGQIYSVEAHMNCEHNKIKRKWLGRFPGGMMFYLGCHLIDLIYSVKGLPDEVIPYNMPTGFENVDADDFGMALLKYKDGISFAKTCAAEPGGFMRRQLVVCGTKGTVELKPIEAYKTNVYDRCNMYTDMRIVLNANGDWNADGEKKRFENYNRYDAMMQNFAQIINGEKENAFPYDYELELNKLVLQSCGIK